MHAVCEILENACSALPRLHRSIPWLLPDEYNKTVCLFHIQVSTWLLFIPVFGDTIESSLSNYCFTWVPEPCSSPSSLSYHLSTCSTWSQIDGYMRSAFVKSTSELTTFLMICTWLFRWLTTWIRLQLLTTIVVSALFFVICCNMSGDLTTPARPFQMSSWISLSRAEKPFLL